MAALDKRMLERESNGTLAGTAQSREPERGSLLPQMAVPLFTADMPFVPGNVRGLDDRHGGESPRLVYWGRTIFVWLVPRSDDAKIDGFLRAAAGRHIRYIQKERVVAGGNIVRNLQLVVMGKVVPRTLAQ